MFHIASWDDIKKGKTTDIYFVRTVEILNKKGIRKRVVAEFVNKKLPQNWEWGIFAGLEECLKLLEGLPVNVEALPEGTVFYPLEPVLVIEGIYNDFAIYETPVLGLICQASGVATKASRFRKIAGKDKTLLDFGARRMHPALAPMLARNAYIGGFDAVSAIKGAELIGAEPQGTMPHALILLLGNSQEAIKAFDEIIDKKVKRVALIDTLEDEKWEAIKVCETLKEKLFGIRFDTPGSRRGNFKEILREVRWELDYRGFKDVKIVVSGGIDEKEVAELRDIVDAFGIGTSLCNSPVIDFAMDIVEIEGKPFAKRGKWSGRKKLLKCKKCGKRLIYPYHKEIKKCECGGEFENLLKPVIKEGKIICDLPSPKEIREYVLNQLEEIKMEGR